MTYDTEQRIKNIIKLFKDLNMIFFSEKRSNYKNIRPVGPPICSSSAGPGRKHRPDCETGARCSPRGSAGYQTGHPSPVPCDVGAEQRREKVRRKTRDILQAPAARSLLAQVFAGDEHPPGPSLPYLLCETDHPKP
jgi:hypothetical protein